MGACVSCEGGCGEQFKGNGDPDQLPDKWTCVVCEGRKRMVPRREYEKPTVTEIAPPHFPTPAIAPPRGEEDYGPTCNARFSLGEQVCALPPRHEGDHASALPNLLQILERAVAGNRHGIGCAELRFPSGECDCWVREAREALRLRRELVGVLQDARWSGCPLESCDCTYVCVDEERRLYERRPAVGGRGCPSHEGYREADGGCAAECSCHLRSSRECEVHGGAEADGCPSCGALPGFYCFPGCRADAPRHQRGQ